MEYGYGVRKLCKEWGTGTLYIKISQILHDKNLITHSNWQKNNKEPKQKKFKYQPKAAIWKIKGLDIGNTGQSPRFEAISR